MLELSNGAIIHPAIIFRNGFEDINLVLYEMPDENSILFHYPRGDFQKWIQDVLGDEELANRCASSKEIFLVNSSETSSKK